MWEVLREVLTAEHTMEGSAPMMEPLREEEEEEEGKGEGQGVEEDKRKGSSATIDLAPWQVPSRLRCSGLCPRGPGFSSRSKASKWLGVGCPLA